MNCPKSEATISHGEGDKNLRRLQNLTTSLTSVPDPTHEPGHFSPGSCFDLSNTFYLSNFAQLRYALAAVHNIVCPGSQRCRMLTQTKR